MATGQSSIQSLLQQLSGVQTAAQGSVPSAVNNGNPNTVYNNAMPVGTQNNPWVQYNPVSGTGGYLPPATNINGQWLINPGPAPSSGSDLDWSKMIEDIAGPTLPTWNPQPNPTNPPPTTTNPPHTGTRPPPKPTTGGPLPPTSVPTTGPTTSGGGGYGLGGGGCVVLETFVEGKEGRAGTIKKRDLMITIDPRNMVKGVDVVTFAETKPQPCVRIRTESGIELECSTTAPIADSKGNQVLAPNLKDVAILVMDNDEPRVEFVVSVEDIGNRLVRHITCGNKFFLAGKEKGRYILHHNIKFAEQEYTNLTGLRDSVQALMESGIINPGGVSPGSNTRVGGAGTTGTTTGSNFDPFSAQGATDATGMVNPMMSANLKALGAGMTPFISFVVNNPQPSATSATQMIQRNESAIKNVLSTIKMNVAQGMDYIKNHSVKSLFSLVSALTGNPGPLIGTLVNAGVSAAKQPDK